MLGCSYPSLLSYFSGRSFSASFVPPVPPPSSTTSTMGNSFSPCLFPDTKGQMVNLVFWGGATRLLSEPQLAGKLMFEFPDNIVCHADSFYIGQPVPALEIHEELLMGNTYFVIPIDRLPCRILTVASLSTLSAGPRRSPIDFGKRPFQYIKSADGRNLIKVVPEFIKRIISEGSHRRSRGCTSSRSGSDSNSTLCTTPELLKHYAQLVGPREQQWSPKLETISECKAGLSPGRLIGLDRR